MSQKNYKESRVRGRKSEDKFDVAASKYDWIKIRDASKNENLLEHWDKLYFVDGRETKIEVKGPKRFHRYKGLQYDYVLLELHGVDRPDNGGWLFDSKAEYIAFEIKEYFICFTIQDVLRFIKEKFGICSPMDNKIWDLRILTPTYSKSPHTETVPYQIYHRLNKDGDDNLDAFTWIPLADLLKIEHLKMPK